MVSPEVRGAPRVWADARTHGLSAAGARRGVAVILLLGFAWRMVGLTAQSFWRDEVDVIFLATRPLEQVLAMFVSPAQNGVLYLLLLRPWFRWVGTSEFALRYTSVLFGTVALALLWQVARRLLPGWRRADLGNMPLVTVLLLAFHPYQVWYSQEGKMYAAVVALTLLSAWTWLRAMARGRGWDWLAYLVATTVAIYTHLLTALMIPLHGLWFLLAWPLNRRRWKGYLLAASGFVLPYLPLIWWQWHYLTSLDYNTGYAFTPFDQVVRVLLLDHSRGVLPTVPTLWLVPVFFLFLASLVVGMGELGLAEQEADDPDPLLPVAAWSRWAILVSWVVVPVLLIHGVSLIKPIFVDRYVIWIGPAVVMLLALGVAAVWHNAGRLGTPLAGGLMALVVALWLVVGWQQVHTPLKTQLRQAVSYVAERRQPNELLILQIPHAQWAYRYYTSDFGPDPSAGSEERLAPWMEGLWTQNGLPDDQARAEVDRVMRERTQGYRAAWVILTEARMWDPRGLMVEWLDTHGRLVEQRIFHQVEVRRYEFPAR